MSRPLSAITSLVLATIILAPGADRATAQQSYLSYELSKLSPNQIKAAYTEQTWQRFVAVTGGSNQKASDDDGPPPTDCPPKPTQECLNSWKVMPVNPFE